MPIAVGTHAGGAVAVSRGFSDQSAAAGFLARRRVAFVIIAITAATRRKSLDFRIEFATKTPNAPHIVCIALRCARATRRNFVNVGSGCWAWKYA
jgi:hypothetical protein